MSGAGMGKLAVVLAPRSAARLLPLLLLAAACRADPPAAVLDTLLEARRTITLDELIASAPLADGEEFRAVEIGRDAHVSQQVVAIRTGETLHRHDRHDLLVVILRGHGRMRLGDDTREVGEGSILYVPRGSVHAFTNGSAEPAYAFTVYAPPFDGKDRAPVDEPSNQETPR
jgi:mannose-6-phosphate isomerase-like protein (cupin superfamily)